MPLAELLRTWSRPALHVQDATFTYLHNPGHFRSILECERMRSDRSGTRFSLAVFDVPTHESARLLAQTLQRRLRATDQAGFLTLQKIAVILWDTTDTGAQEFLVAMREQHAPQSLPACEIYIYPSQWPTELPEVAAKFDPVTDLLGPRETRPLEELFTQPLPVWKRCLDILGASVGLVVLSPLLATVALAVKLTSPGPILFRQLRDGLGGRQFTIYKFRTMYQDAEARQGALRAHSEQDGPAFKLQNDPRITPLGSFFRKTCIDELPQLWNVLRGDMTLVGPRPLDSRESRQICGWGRRRLEVTPGLTCIWQVYGKSKVTFAEWMRMDIRYMRARTLKHDLQLVWKTLCQVIRSKASH